MLILTLTSCEGFKHIRVYNLSNDSVLIYTSQPSSGFPQDFLDTHPEFDLRPSYTLTEKQRIVYFKNLFGTNNNISENSNKIEISMQPKTYIQIGGRITVFPGKVKPNDLYIDTLIINYKMNTIKADSRTRIINLAKDNRFQYKRKDKAFIEINDKRNLNIVIR